MMKRGELTMTGVLGALILVLILVFLGASGFLQQWFNFDSNTKAFAPSDVVSHVEACKLACRLGSSSEFSYCTSVRKVHFGEEVKDAPDGEVRASCSELAEKYPEFGFGVCDIQQC
jgi:predicted RND superfamily exporter protein